MAVCAAFVAAGDGTRDVRALDYVSGDADCSGAVGAGDAIRVLAFAGDAGDAMCAGWAGDVNCDGLVDGTDAMLILRYAAQFSDPQGGGCPDIGEPTETPPTSYELIDASVTAGDITLGEGLLYKLYADFGDARLPDEYDAHDGPSEPSLLFQQIAAVWETLSSDEQEALSPFLVAPTNPESAFAASGITPQGAEWQGTHGDQISVWWQTARPQDATKATAVLNAMQDKIWPDIVTYMGREPLADSGYRDDGGSSRYDIYLFEIPADDDGNPPVLGYVKPRTDAQGGYACEQTPTSMSLNSVHELTPSFLSTVAHEFMHSVQFTYDVGSCDDYRWLMEATATWAEHFVYPRVDDEHVRAYAFLEDLQKPFETWIYKDQHQYGAYLFWFFLGNRYGLYEAVADTWAAATNPDSLAAIQAVIAGRGGFEDVWPEFALYNWNRPPYDEYTQWDKVALGAKWKDIDVEAGPASKSYAIPTDLKHMTQDHYHYQIMDSVHSLTFINPFAGSGETRARVQALILRDGQWTRPALDWTDEERVHFCLDKEEEDVDELVIIISNSEHLDRNKTFDVGPAELVASPFGCEGWSGAVTASYRWHPAGDIDVYYTSSNQVLFQFIEGEDIDNDRYISYSIVDGGSWTWHAEGTWPGSCTGVGNRTLDAPRSGTEGETIGNIIIDKQEGTYSFAVSAHRWGDYITLQCGDHTEEDEFPPLFFAKDCELFDDHLEVDDQGNQKVEGDCVGPMGVYDAVFTWSLTELKKAE